MSGEHKLQIHIPKKKTKFTMSGPVEALTPKKSLPVLPNEIPVRGPMDPLEREAHKAKYLISEVCAHCNHWYRGRDRDLKMEDGVTAKCAAPGTCGGLGILMGYPHYEGPLSLDQLREFCAVCGEVAPKSVGTSDGRRIGYCLHHLDMALKHAEHFKRTKR